MQIITFILLPAILFQSHKMPVINLGFCILSSFIYILAPSILIEKIRGRAFLIDQEIY